MSISLRDRAVKVRQVFIRGATANCSYSSFLTPAVNDCPSNQSFLYTRAAVHCIPTLSIAMPNHWPIRGRYNWCLTTRTSFKGSVLAVEPVVRIEYDRKRGGLHIRCENPGKERTKVEVIDNAYGYGKSESLSIEPQKSKKIYQQLTKSGNWFDYSINSSTGMKYRQLLFNLSPAAPEIAISFSNTNKTAH